MSENVSFLNYTRSLSFSEGYMYGASDEGKAPVEVITRTVRGTKSSYKDSQKDLTSAGDLEETDDSGNPTNIQTVQVAFLPREARRLLVDYSLVVTPNSLTPSGCNSEWYGEQLKELAEVYAAKGGYKYLAERYLWNMINCRALWRNAIALSKKVTIQSVNHECTWSFEADGILTPTFPGTETLGSDFHPLAEMIAASLSGEAPPLFLQVTMEGDLPGGTEVYPSQEFIGNGKSDSKDRLSKVLSQAKVMWRNHEVNQATLHSQKIGNAIRRIDEWHNHVDELGAIPVEPLGSVQERQMSVRSDVDESGRYAKTFFYYLKNLSELRNRLETESRIPDEVHYFMAVLIRGGVFSMESAKNSKKKPKGK